MYLVLFNYNVKDVREIDLITSYFESLVINAGAFNMTDTELEQFCVDNSELRIERNEKKEITIMPPSFAKTGAFHHLLGVLLGEWNRKEKAGIILDSSTGFFLPDGSMRSPDLAWIPITKWKTFSDEEKNSFLRYCPEFIVEVKSKTDKLPHLQNKMKAWILNGAKLCWLIDPEKENIWIYRKDGSETYLSGFNGQLYGEDILLNFTLNLEELRFA